MNTQTTPQDTNGTEQTLATRGSLSSFKYNWHCPPATPSRMGGRQ